MASEDLFSREEVLGGLPAQRARTLLYLVENRAGQLAAQARRAMERFLTETAAEERDLAFLEAFTAGKDPPLRPAIQDLERFAPQWAGLVPDNPGVRAAVAHLLGEKYSFTHPSVPGIRRALGLEQEAVKRAYQRQYQRAVESIYAAQPGLLDRLRWGWAHFSGWLESLPPFWTAFSLTLTETVGAGIMALPIALAGLGPMAGVILLFVMGLVNILTIAYMAEAVSRSGDIRYGKAYFGRLVADYLGREGSLILSLALVLINTLVLMAYYIGLSTTIAAATRVPATVWVALVFLVDLYFVRRRSLNATISAALMVGAVNIGIILAISVLTIPWIRAENLGYFNVPFLNGRPFEPSILQLVFGVVLAAYFGHTSMGNCAKVVLRRDPSGRALLWGAVAAQVAAIFLYSIWLLTVNGALSPAALADLPGTVLEPLAARVGPVVNLLGLVFVILGMGMASIHFSLGFYNLIQEWLPKKRQPVLLLSRRRGRLIFQDTNNASNPFNLSLAYLGLKAGQPQFRLDLQTNQEVHSLDITARSHLDAKTVLQHLPRRSRREINWQADILEISADTVQLRFNTSLSLSFAGDWSDLGFGASGLISLPPRQRKLMDWIMRQGQASLAELAAHTRQPERVVQSDVEALAAQGFLRIVEAPEGRLYRPQMASKKARSLPKEIWEALGDPSEAPPDPTRRPPGPRGRLGQLGEILLSGRSLFLLGISPIVLIFLLVEWLLWTGNESFSRPLGFMGVIVVSLMGGIFPALLLVAGRRKGEYVPQAVVRFIGHPALTGGVYLLTLGAIFVHGLFIWQNPFERAVALGVGLGMLGLTAAMVRRRAFAPRMVVELRQDQPQAGGAQFSITAGGHAVPAEVQLEYADGWQEYRSPGGEVPQFARLRQAIFILPAGQARDLKVWAHRITAEGDSEALPASLEFQQGSRARQFDLKLSRGQALVPLSDELNGGIPFVRLVLAGEGAG